MQKSDIIVLKRVISKKRGVLFVAFIGIFLAAFYSYYLFRIFSKTKSELVKVRADINAVREQVSKIDKNTYVTVKESGKSIDLFMPKEFELFSIISFIDSVSRKTNMRVDSVVLTPPKGTLIAEDKKSVSILGDMTFQEFLDFLKKYKYITGRLLAVQELNITTLETDSIKLAATIYAYDPKINIKRITIGSLTPSERQVLEKIQKTVQQQENSTVSDSYSNKRNPFE